jgi:hypothetical protein
MLEYNFYDGDHFITFDIIDINEERQSVTVAISEQGRITQDTFFLLSDKEIDEELASDIRYFEFGLYADKIYLADFENL